jgi:hypothetical protein
LKIRNIYSVGFLHPDLLINDLILLRKKPASKCFSIFLNSHIVIGTNHALIDFKYSK